MGFILANMSSEECGKFSLKNLGMIVCAYPPNQTTLIDYTGDLGSVTNIYYSLTFALTQDDFKLQKADEWMEVSPVHAQYYQLVQQQKEVLEGKIKQGLSSVAQAVSDYELVLHDLREYKKFLKLDENGEPILKDHKVILTDDEPTLKTIFVQQVDYHTGETTQTGPGRLSMEFLRNNNILPTIVEDFICMSSLEDLEKHETLKQLPLVEKNLLKTKWQAYENWKKLFAREVVNRYNRINQLATARKKSVDEYREWLKPTITRYKLIKEALENPEKRKAILTSFLSSPGRATSFNGTELWLWKDYSPQEFFKTPGELVAKGPSFLGLHMKPLIPYDEFVKKHLVFNEEYGLKSDYLWITEEWVNKQVEYIQKNWMKAGVLYYTFFTIDLVRTNLKSATGGEIEDGEFTIKAFMLSQNALLAKLLELRAKQEELERYIDELLGISVETSKTPEKVEEKKPKFDISGFFSSLGLGFKFLKRGPYERDLRDRITKFYLKPMGKERYVQIVKLLHSKMKIGD